MQALVLNGAPGEIRTPDLLVRSQTLYPTELRARLLFFNQLRRFEILCTFAYRLSSHSISGYSAVPGGDDRVMGL